MERVTASGGVTYEPDHVGGISGVWCHPENARPGGAVLHIHGGWFNWGSAYAFRHLAGQIAAQAGVPAFVPDYGLAPEHPFPAAPEDVRVVYFGLLESGFTKIAITGDSAGGNLALGLLAFLNTNSATARSAVVGSVALSPVTDLSLSGRSWSTCAVANTAELSASK
jgi:epsilon-lactone hydrolase